MKIISFNYNKINIEKNKNDFKDLKIENLIDIKSIKEIKNEIIKNKDTFLNVSFSYILDYKENIAKIIFEGNILISLEEEKAKEILEDWNKKQLNSDLRLNLINKIMIKCNAKALILEEEMNLPYHFKLPSLTMKKK